MKTFARGNKILIIMFIIFIVVINILNIITPDKEMSESENRVLGKMPDVSLKNIISGKFTKKFERYVTDQFIFRDVWVGLKSDIERLRLQKENKGIFFGKDNYLLENYEKPKNQLLENINSINTFYSNLKDIDMYFLLPPNSVKIYEEKLPVFASPYDQLKVINNVKKNLNKNIRFIDVYNTLNKHKDEYIYFRTDHHWTMKGAYYAYLEFCKAINIKPHTLEDYKSEFITDSFFGTYYSKASNYHLRPDKIELFTPKFDTNYKVCYINENNCTDTLYNFDYLNKKDKYGLFLNGNKPLITINSNADNEDNILILKDSYSHSFIPFLANEYSNIHVIDLRYYNMNIDDYIKENDINKILFLYNVSTFSNDTNLKKLSY